MLSLNDPCSDDATICNFVYSETDSTAAANVADWLVGKPMALIGLALLGLVIRWVLHRVIDRVVKRAETGMMPNRFSRAMTGGKVGTALNIHESAGATRRVQRAQTMGTLLKSIVTGIILAVIGTMMLSEIGVNVAPIIASAGILGLAIGFGAQSLVSDFLSGIFMIFEDQYGVGDEVDLGEAVGTVEAVSLRVTRLRDVNGTVWYVRNGEILRVGNMSQNWARTVLDISVAYGEDVAQVQRVLADVAHDLWVDEDFKGRVIEEPSVWGVQDITPDAVVVRVALKTAPLEQWAVAREMRQRIKARFDLEGIEMPFAQRVVWMRSADSEPAQPEVDIDSAPPAKGPAQAEGPA
ncbi:mechanosensitive ion channel family protein [Nocardioides sp. Soil777]|uniref:mechanosensitive ion channel family protein n=1 Tax=Nocardioides sp. Soil777 TaxID=1736409 RepID=UPI0009EC162F|nr:mechanosensitive ion channel family protein [Nocardioides sp. Soil777]